MSWEHVYLVSEHLPELGFGFGLALFATICARRAGRPAARAVARPGAGGRAVDGT